MSLRSILNTGSRFSHGDVYSENLPREQIKNFISGQFGSLSFSPAAMIAFLVASLLSVLDSIGDYYACARMCRVPPPPSHAVNRGITIEGLCSIISGALGCGHGTSSYGTNTGGIGISKVGILWSKNKIFISLLHSLSKV